MHGVAAITVEEEEEDYDCASKSVTSGDANCMCSDSGSNHHGVQGGMIEVMSPFATARKKAS